MYLHNNKDLFRSIVLEVSNKLKLRPSLVEKDYYVFLLLKLIQSNFPDVLFKGGTSLSKGYGIINRFSEDIDLSMISTNMMSEGQRRTLNHVIENAFNELGLPLMNKDIKYKSDFVCFKSTYDTLFNDNSITDFVKVESVLRRKGRVTNFKYELREISNYIFDYYHSLDKDKYKNFLVKNGLVPFDIYCYDIRYTLCDKLIAIGNNYLRGRSERLSRHLYDVYKLLGVIKIDDSLRDIFLHTLDCTKERGFDDSIRGNNNLEVFIYKSLVEDFYKSDYENISSKFIFDTVDYLTLKNSLLMIVDIGLCDTVTKNGLRFNKVISKISDRDTVYYQYEDIRTGQAYNVSRDYIIANNLAYTFTNYKLSKDKRLIKRF